MMKGAYSSAGERYVDIVKVTGSIPVTPTNLFYAPLANTIVTSSDALGDSSVL
jgi:hypothetical protein